MRNSLTGKPIEQWGLQRGDDVVQVKTTGRLTVAEFGTLLSACVARVGVARIKALGVRHLIERGALVELLPDWSGGSFPLHAFFDLVHAQLSGETAG